MEKLIYHNSPPIVWWGRLFFLCLVSNVTLVYLFLWGPSFLSVSCAQCYPCLSFLVECVFFLCLVPTVLRVYLFWWGPCLLSVSCAHCSPCLSFLVGSVSSFCVLCPMLPVSIFFGAVCVFFLCLVSNVTHVYLFWWGPCLSFCVMCPMLQVSIILCHVSNVIRVYFVGGICVFFLCLVSNVTRVHRSVSCGQCYPCLSF